MCPIFFLHQTLYIIMEMYIPIRCPPYILSYCDTGMTSMIGDGGLDPEDAEVVVLP